MFENFDLTVDNVSYKAQAAKLHHQVVKVEVAHCTSLDCFSVFCFCLDVVLSCVISVLRLRSFRFPVCLSLDCHFILYLLLIPPPGSTSPLLSISFLFFILFSLFHLAFTLEKKGYIRRTWRVI